MEIGVLEWYLVGINVLGFVMYGVNTFLYAHKAKWTVDALLTIVSALGGSIGIFLFIILFDRGTVKANMMSRVYLVSIMIIQIVAYLFFRGFHSDKIIYAFWKPLEENLLLKFYLLVINIITLVAFGIDKIRAVERKRKVRRIRILTLLGLSFAGGSIGALIGMYAFRHKTSKDYFTVGIPLILTMQIVVLFYLVNI